ncbi:hypothetical protein [Geodermatophilus sp. SYSU D00815]
MTEEFDAEGDEHAIGHAHELTRGLPPIESGDALSSVLRLEKHGHSGWGLIFAWRPER